MITTGRKGHLMAKWNWQDELDALKKENARLREERDHWEKLWEKAATRVLQLEPDVKIIAEIKPRKPDPWQDV